MEFHSRSSDGASCDPAVDDQMDLRRGPWTVEEDLALMNYIHAHGEGRWNSLASCAGLRRTGKSCRLRWLNYLRPDVRRGNITPEEQLLILELHSRWGNRWSKIAQHLPGRTDNEIKNYWRTRVQKHAKQLKCDVNSKQFKDVMRYLWMPRLAERIRAAADAAAAAAVERSAHAPAGKLSPANSSSLDSAGMEYFSPPPASDAFGACGGGGECGDENGGEVTRTSGELAGCCWSSESAPSLEGYDDLGLPDFDQSTWENLWSVEDIWLQEQF